MKNIIVIILEYHAEEKSTSKDKGVLTSFANEPHTCTSTILRYPLNYTYLHHELYYNYKR